jgi:flagellin
MAIYFNTNLPETRGLLSFDRTTTKINDILQRLNTGYRINSGKDDPTGLIKREGLRLEMKGLQSAINNSIAGQSLITVAEKAMGSIASLLTGDPTDSQDTGIIGLLNSSNSDTNSITAGINQLADTIDAISRTTIYNGKQIINGAYDYRTSVTNTNVSSKKGNITNVKVTSANTTGSKTTDFGFTVDEIAQRAGVKIEDLIVTSYVDEDIEFMLTDNEGKSVKFTKTTDTSGKITDADLKSKIEEALQGEDINLELESDILRSKDKGGNQNITITATKLDGGAADITTAFTSAGTGYSDVDTPTAIGTVTAQGQDWSFGDFEGTVVTDGNNVSVYSNSINFSGIMADNTEEGAELKLSVAGGTSFQLGKNVSSDGQYNLGIATINSSNLSSKDGKTTLAKLRSLDYSNKDNVILAQKTLEDIASQIATERGRLGTIQKSVLGTNQINLEDQLAIVTESEATISNTDAALESSRLARQELIADSAMNAILYARSFSQFAVSSLFQ